MGRGVGLRSGTFRKLRLTPVMIDSTKRGVLTGKGHLKNNKHLTDKIYVSIKHSLVSNAQEGQNASSDDFITASGPSCVPKERK